MNITEKRRAEQMIKDWQFNAANAVEHPNAKKMEVPSDVRKEVEAIVKEVESLKARVKKVTDQGYALNGLRLDNRLVAEVTVLSPAYKVAVDKQQSDLAAIRSKADRLIVEVWDGKHTFATLAEELK